MPETVDIQLKKGALDLCVLALLSRGDSYAYEIASRLAEGGVSIESMIQRGRAPGEPVSIVMITHECSHEAVARALKVIAASDRVLGAPCMIPMEAG